MDKENFKKVTASVDKSPNYFHNTRQALTNGNLASVSGNESYTEFQKALDSVDGSESLKVKQMFTGFNQNNFDAIKSAWGKDIVARAKSVIDGYDADGQKFAAVAGQEGFSLQNFGGDEQSIRAANLVLNAQSHLQTKGADALYAPISIGYKEEGVEMTVRAAGLGTYTYGATAFQSASDLRPVFGLLRSGDMFQEEVLAVYPVYPADDAADERRFFAPAALSTPVPVKYMAGDAYGRQEHLTQDLVVPVTIPNFLALTQTPGQQPWTNTDELESNSIAVKRIGVKVMIGSTEKTFFINTASMSNNTFGVGGQVQSSDERTLNLKISQYPGFSVQDKDGNEIGETIFADFKAAGYEPRLQLQLTGTYQRQRGDITLLAGAVNIAELYETSTKVVVKYGKASSQQQGLFNTLKSGTVVSARTGQNVNNTNRGNFGYRVEVYDAYKHLSVQRRSPISVQYPVSDKDVYQESLDFALKQMSIIINNQCSKTAFVEARRHTEYIKQIDGSAVVANTQGSEVLAGQHFLTPTCVDRKLKLSDVVSANGSYDVWNAVSAAITNEIADIIAALYTRSGLAAVAEYTTGDLKGKWSVVAHQNISRFIFRSGDARTVGPVDQANVVETNFDSEIGYVTIVPKNDSSSEVIDPLAGIGVVVTKENIVVQGNVTRGNKDFGVVMTLPTYKHWGLNVVIGRLFIEDAHLFLTDDGLINDLAVKAVRLANANEIVLTPVVDPNAP
jgi:hypothetical protein